MVTISEAIKKVIENCSKDGAVSLKDIYDNIETYYPNVKQSENWKDMVRGILYRDIKEERIIKRVGLGLYAFKNYKEENILEEKEDVVKTHTIIEGILIETGNKEEFETYTPDKSKIYRENVLLSDIQTLDEIPEFTYTELIKKIKRIDVLWFSNKKFKFPIKAFEVVDSIATLPNSLNRCWELNRFNVELFIVAPKEHKSKYDSEIEKQMYEDVGKRIRFIDYDFVKRWYEKACVDDSLKFPQITQPLNN